MSYFSVPNKRLVFLQRRKFIVECRGSKKKYTFITERSKIAKYLCNLCSAQHKFNNEMNSRQLTHSLVSGQLLHHNYWWSSLLRCRAHLKRQKLKSSDHSCCLYLLLLPVYLQRTTSFSMLQCVVLRAAGSSLSPVQRRHRTTAVWPHLRKSPWPSCAMMSQPGSRPALNSGTRASMSRGI